MQDAISRRTVLVAATAVAATTAIALGAGRASAAGKPVSFKVPLTGAQQVPPVETKGSGTAALTYDASDRKLSWDVAYHGLSSPVTMAHFHGPAPTGKNAGVQIWISKKGEPVSSPIKGSAELSPEQAKMFEAGEMYVNVHTKDHPSGEIRGQVKPPKVG